MATPPALREQRLYVLCEPSCVSLPINCQYQNEKKTNENTGLTSIIYVIGNDTVVGVFRLPWLFSNVSLNGVTFD
jgi:hypothetical protein